MKFDEKHICEYSTLSQRANDRNVSWRKKPNPTQTSHMRPAQTSLQSSQEIDVFSVGHEVEVRAVHQVHWRHLETVRIAYANSCQSAIPTGAGKGLLIAGWHLEDRQFRPLGGAVFAAAAIILATCTSENSPELVAQSLPGSPSQKGQRKDSGLSS
jgi:hypothetical protein